jgi:hypothetical protein
MDEVCYVYVMAKSSQNGLVAPIHLLCISYRAMLACQCKNKSLHDGLLDCAGVIWAEKRFGLALPNGAFN